jgi:acetoin utilization deacetylase AcuC-like enzyme
MTTAYISHPDFMKHEMGHHHPECPERIQAIEDQLIQSRLDSHLKRIDPPLATEADITRVHSEDHLAFIKSKAPTSGYAMIDGDTIMNTATWNVSLRAAGAAIAAVDAVMKGEVNNAFCAIRPPGHHAEPHRSMGFCVFNTIAIATRYALEQYDLDRVAVIDFDVHHGNGTEAAFIDDPHVLMCSFFQHPFYPYSGLEGGDNMVNIPLPASTSGKVVREMISKIWIPHLQAFKPQLIMISAGFDAHREDDLGQMGLVEDDYVWITQQLMNVANQTCKGKIVSCLEGGYNLSALGRSVVAHLKTLAEL